MGQKGDGREPTAIFRVAEAEIARDLRQQAQALLQACFPGYPSRSYFKLPPHFRYLAMTSGAMVELRVIRVASTVLRTFGVVDLCVRTSERSHGLITPRGAGYSRGHRLLDGEKDRATGLADR